MTRRLAAVDLDVPFLGGGIFLWAKLPTELESTTVLKLAKARGILLAPGELFHANGKATGHYRFNVACPDHPMDAHEIKIIECSFAPYK